MISAVLTGHAWCVAGGYASPAATLLVVCSGHLGPDEAPALPTLTGIIAGFLCPAGPNESSSTPILGE